jgi:hypothetical protein
MTSLPFSSIFWPIIYTQFLLASFGAYPVTIIPDSEADSVLFFRLFHTLLVNLNSSIRTHPKTKPTCRTASGVDFFRIGKSLIVKVLGQTEVFLGAK